jgi:hypothetical protein
MENLRAEPEQVVAVLRICTGSMSGLALSSNPGKTERGVIIRMSYLQYPYFCPALIANKNVAGLFRVAAVSFLDEARQHCLCWRTCCE